MIHSKTSALIHKNVVSRQCRIQRLQLPRVQKGPTTKGILQTSALASSFGRIHTL